MQEKIRRQYWTSVTQRAECERLQQAIVDAFPEASYIECYNFDEIPSVTLGGPDDEITTPAQVLAFGRRLKEVVGDYPVLFLELQAHHATFLVVHELTRDGQPFPEGYLQGYGVPFEKLESAWSR